MSGLKSAIASLFAGFLVGLIATVSVQAQSGSGAPAPTAQEIPASD